MTGDGLKGAECDGGKGMHERDGFRAGESITGAFSVYKLCKDIKIGLCVSNSSGFGSDRPIERGINAGNEIRYCKN